MKKKVGPCSTLEMVTGYQVPGSRDNARNSGKGLYLKTKD